MESEYGKGSVFTALIPQTIETETPFAAVEEPEKKKVLVYEGRINYAKSVCWTLENMKVPHTMVTNQDDFAAALYRAEWFYVFSSYGLYEKIEPIMKQSDTAFRGGKKPPLALMIEWGTESYIPGVRFVSIPVQSISIANVLNGRKDDKGYIKTSGIIRFTFPCARLLVVDDIATNLKVVEGLLAPYHAEVDTCLNGLQSIEMVKRNEYDIVFMDHMMPEMDGIEATTVIRSLEDKRFRTMPIIALTANAVMGMREMYIENGFNDFLSKPIDVSKLDEILNKWIPKEKRDAQRSPVGVETASPRSRYPVIQSPEPRTPIPIIPGIDTAKGIVMTGGTVAAYTKVLSLLCKDIEDRLPLLQKALDGNLPLSDILPAFVTHVHALKSALASIGAQNISSLAAGLEAVGKAGDIDFIRESLPDFIEQLLVLGKNIGDALEPDKLEYQDVHQGGNAAPPVPIPQPLFQELAGALKSQKISEIKRILNTLNQQAQDSRLKEILEQISDQVLMTEFDRAVEIVEELITAKN
jgi:CheY-like chemotaxis protein